MTNEEYDSYINSRSSSSSSSTNFYGDNNNHDSNSYGNNNYGYNSARQREPCNPISMKGAIQQDEFFDMRFCGTRGGSAFINVQRPELVKETEKYACPSGSVACSTETKDESTICVKTAKKATDCPLTTMKFVEKSKATTTSYPAASYKIQKVDDEYSFVTSAVKGDNLPLTSFKLENKPCLDDRDTSRASTS